MRNLTKVLAMVLALTMMVSVVGFAANFTDVEKGASYEEAVKVLSDLGLVQGMGDGTFGADLNLTRAQGAAFVIRLMGLEETAVSATGLDTGFADVAADHWATGYIYTGVQKGIINGMGDGTFAPDAELTFAQLVKMVVVALGYEPLAAELGEWPGNYITAASQIKLTKGIAGSADATITRATTARVLFAALTIPKMEKKGVGVNALWEPRNTLILDDLGFYKMIGKITAVDLVNGEATVTITEQAKAVNGEYKETSSDMDITSGTYDIGSFGAELKNYINLDANLYFTYANREYVLVSVVEDNKEIDTISLTTADFSEYDDAKNEVTYYTNEEQTKDDEFELADTIAVYVNGEEENASMAAATFVATYLDDTAAECFIIEIKDTDGDGEFDYAIITEYDYMVVADIDVNKHGLYTLEGEDLEFDYVTELEIDTDDEADALVKIIKDGKEISVADIEVGDTLNIVTAEDYTSALEVATIYVTNDTVEGKVKYADDGVALIGDEEYDYVISDVVAGAEGTFYLSILGQIIYADDAVVTAAYDYGFATTVDFVSEEGVAESGSVKILTTEGKWVTLDLANKVTVNGTEIEMNEYEPADDADELDAVAFGTVNDEKAKYYYNSVVAYKLNSNGAVKELLTTVAAMGDKDIVSDDSVTAEYKEYEDEDSELGAYVITEATVIYNFTEDAFIDGKITEEEVAVTDLSVLVDEKEYTVGLYNISEKTDVPAIMVGNFEADIDFEANWFVVSGAFETVYGDDTAIQVNGVANGEKVTYYITDDSEIGLAADTDVHVCDDGCDDPCTEEEFDGILDNLTAGDEEDLVKGAVVLVKANADNEIVDACVLGNINDYVEENDDVFSYDFSAFAANVFTDAIIEGAEKDSTILAGFVAKTKGSKVYFAFDGDETLIEDGEIDKDAVDAHTFATTYTYTNNTVVTVFDFTASKNNVVTAGSTRDIKAGNAVFARVDEYNKLQEVVVIITDEIIAE